jgi:cell division protein FtsB
MKEVNVGIWKLLTQIISVLLGAACLLAIFIWYLPLIEQNQRLRREILLLNHEVRKEETLAKQLRVSINALQKDPRTVERLARERLGYSKPGETVIRFEPALTKATPGQH